MNKISTITLGGLLVAAISSAAYAEPTRTFSSETADIAANGSASLDLEYGTGTTAGGTGVRIGAFGGEVFLNNNNSGFASSSIGYKAAFQKNLAGYAIFSYLDDGAVATTDIALGVAYTIKMKAVTFNINGEFITDDANIRGGNTTIFVKGAIKFPINKALPSSSLIAEITAENNDAIDGTIDLGLRWSPSKRVTADIMFYVGNETPNADDTIGIPGAITLNVAF